MAVGLETTNDAIREKSIDKGNTFADFKQAAEIAHKAGVSIKAYLMMKPLFLTEREAMDDMQKSIAEVAPYADMISMNLCTVQGKTELEQYWQRGSFRPPYLWSAVKVLLDADVFVPAIRLAEDSPAVRTTGQSRWKAVWIRRLCLQLMSIRFLGTRRYCRQSGMQGRTAARSGSSFWRTRLPGICR